MSNSFSLDHQNSHKSFSSENDRLKNSVETLKSVAKDYKIKASIDANQKITAECQIANCQHKNLSSITFENFTDKFKNHFEIHDYLEKIIKFSNNADYKMKLFLPNTKHGETCYFDDCKFNLNPKLRTQKNAELHIHCWSPYCREKNNVVQPNTSESKMLINSHLPVNYETVDYVKDMYERISAHRKLHELNKSRYYWYGPRCYEMISKKCKIDHCAQKYLHLETHFHCKKCKVASFDTYQEGQDHGLSCTFVKSKKNEEVADDGVEEYRHQN